MGNTNERTKQLEEFQSKFRQAYVFRDLQILNTALTHSSYSSTDNYRKLEWLGDGILRFITTVHLYAQYPDRRLEFYHNKREEMEENETLYEIADQLEIEKYLITGNGFNADAFASKGDLVEALIGAIYVDAKKYGKDWQEPIRKFMSLYWTSPDDGKNITFKDVGK